MIEDRQVLRDLLVIMGPLVPLDHLDPLVSQAQWVIQEILDKLDPLDFLDQKDHLDHRVHLVLPETKAYLEVQDFRDQLARVVH